MPSTEIRGKVEISKRLTKALLPKIMGLDGSITSNNPDVMSNQIDTTVQLGGQTTEIDLGVIGEDHVLGKLERGKNIIYEKRKKEGT